jgi:hypothetical protein
MNFSKKWPLKKKPNKLSNLVVYYNIRKYDITIVSCPHKFHILKKKHLSCHLNFDQIYNTYYWINLQFWNVDQVGLQHLNNQ